MQESDVKNEFIYMLYDRFGLKLDPSLLTDNPDFKKIEEELQKQWEQREGGKKPKSKLAFGLDFGFGVKRSSSSLKGSSSNDISFCEELELFRPYVNMVLFCS